MIFTKRAALNKSGGVTIEFISPYGSKDIRDIFHIQDLQILAYKSLDEVPEDIRNKINLLRWMPPDDYEPITDVGCRAGDDTFWLL